MKGGLAMNARMFSILGAIALAALLSAGCASHPLTLGKTEAGSSLFKNPEELEFLKNQLTPGMTKQEVFQILGITPKTQNLEPLDPERIQRLVYGNTQPSDSVQNIEKFRIRRLAFSGYLLPYKYIQPTWWLSLPKWTTRYSGYDLNLYLVFDDNKLYEAALAGPQNVDKKETTYIWTAFGRLFEGAAQNSVGRAIR